MFKDKKFLRNMATLTIPIMLQELLNSSVNILDTFMIGRLGDEAVASVGLANQIFFLFVLITFGVNSGGSIFIGQYYGKGDYEGIHKIMGCTLTISFLAALIFWCGAMFFPRELMSIYSKDTKVIELGVGYLKIISFSYFLSAVIVTLNAALKSTNVVIQPMITTFISLMSNFILNLLFIFGLNMGVRGAAIATLCARLIELTVQIIMIIKYKRIIGTNLRKYFIFDKEIVNTFFRVCTPVILNEFMWALGNTVYNVAYKYSGTVAQAATQISGTVQNLFMVAGIAIGSACGIIISNTLGAGDSKRAIEYSRKCCGLGIVFSIFMGVILAFASPFIVDIFKVGDEAKTYALYMLYVVSVCMVFKTFNYVTIVGILRNGGDTTFCLLLDTLTVWLIGVPMAFLGSKYLGLPIYVTFAMVYLEEVVKVIISSIRVWKNKWANSVI